jgi:N-dimethylarginine dimethylaminohydrolase
MRVGAADTSRALTQHEAFRAALRREAVELLELPFVHGAFDSVFAKDSALLVESRGVRRALLSHPRHAVRRREQKARGRALEALGFDVHEPPRVHWEGGDVVMLPNGQGILLGHGPRSHPAAACWIERLVGLEVTTLELRDPHFFHLDVALCCLGDGTVLVCETALTPESVSRLRRLSALRDVVSVPLREAASFGLNLVCIGDSVVLAPGVRASFIEREVRARGYRVVFTPLDEFHHAGGSAACLVAQLHRTDALDARK